VTAIPRVGGRAIIRTPDGRVLLIHERLETGTHWLTPGGGLEPGELPHEAAIREAREETGADLVIAEDAEAVLVTRRLWSWAGVEYDQVDHFFLVPVAEEFVPRPCGLTPIEQSTLIGYHWWTLPELAATDAVILPADLATVLSDLPRGA
jgi:8-oxo-dGTP pyrophosphatase MutT (NUDIX family)